MRCPWVAPIVFALPLVLAIALETEGGGGGSPTNLCPGIAILDGPRFSGHLIGEQLVNPPNPDLATVRVTLIATGQRPSGVIQTHAFQSTYFATDVFSTRETLANVSPRRLEGILALRPSAPSPAQRGFCLESRGRDLFLSAGVLFLTAIDGLTRGATYETEEGRTLFRVARVSGIAVPIGNLGR